MNTKLTGDDVLACLVNMIAERVVDLMEARGGAPKTPEWATARNNPLGSPRAFLDAARAGHFPSSKRGREVVARWEDVEAYDRARMRPRSSGPKSGVTHTTSSDERRLAALRRARAL